VEYILIVLFFSAYLALFLFPDMAPMTSNGFKEDFKLILKYFWYLFLVFIALSALMEFLGDELAQIVLIVGALYFIGKNVR